MGKSEHIFAFKNYTMINCDSQKCCRHLASRVQVGSPVTMKAIVMPPQIIPEDEIKKPTFEKKDLVWEEDEEMYSKFLDRKVHRIDAAFI